MAETLAHKRYMAKYNERKRLEKLAQDKAATEVTDPTPQWRTRRHATTSATGEPTTSHLFDLRSKLTLQSERRPLPQEDEDKKLEIEAILRSRGELAPLPHNYHPCSCV